MTEEKHFLYSVKKHIEGGGTPSDTACKRLLEIIESKEIKLKEMGECVDKLTELVHEMVEKNKKFKAIIDGAHAISEDMRISFDESQTTIKTPE